jgi:hypothetical protein
MKKYKVPVLVLFMLILLVAGSFIIFSIKANHYDRSVSKENTIDYNRLSKEVNTDRFDEFLKNVEDENKDRINIIHYTIEGDPLITQLYFNGKDVIIYEDNSKDGWGGPDKDKIIQTTIKGSNKLKDDLFKYINSRRLII